MRIDKLWVVTTPSDISTIADICFCSSLRDLALQFRGGLDPAEIVGAYTDQVEANEAAQALLVARRGGK